MSMEPALKILPHYTYDDYLHWEGRWEIIHGVPYAMSPLPVPKHQQIASDLLVEFGIAFKKFKHCKAYQPLDYKLKNDTVLQPDLLVVCQPIAKKFLDFAPSLVVEILSPATADKDRLVKFPLYEAEHIPYYLIISPDTELVEVYQYVDGSYRLQQTARDFTFTFSFPKNCTAEIDFSQIW